MNTPDPIFAWQEIGVDGRWGTIAAIIPGIGKGASPLITRSERVAQEMTPLAAAHQRASGRAVRLHRFLPDPHYEKAPHAHR